MSNTSVSPKIQKLKAHLSINLHLVDFIEKGQHNLTGHKLGLDHKYNIRLEEGWFTTKAALYVQFDENHKPSRVRSRAIYKEKLNDQEELRYVAYLLANDVDDTETARKLYG